MLIAKRRRRRRGRGKEEEEEKVMVKHKTTGRNPGVRMQRNQMSDLEAFLKRGDRRASGFDNCH